MNEPSGLLIFAIMFGLILGIIGLMALGNIIMTGLTRENLATAARWVWGVLFPAVRSLLPEGPRPRSRRSLVRASKLRPRAVRGAGGRFQGSLPAVVSEGNEEATTLQPVTPLVAASESDVTSPPIVAVTGNEVTISVTEAVMIATRLTQGMSASDVVKSLPGYSPKKNYAEYKMKVDQVRAALACLEPAEDPQEVP